MTFIAFSKFLIPAVLGYLLSRKFFDAIEDKNSIGASLTVAVFVICIFGIYEIEKENNLKDEVLASWSTEE